MNSCDKKIIFTFASNLGGRHGKGSALEARMKHGAIYGQGVGPQGNSYAIPTKDAKLNRLNIAEIRKHVDDFKKYAAENPELLFHVVAIGCGLAGFTPKQMKPLFEDCPPNCVLPEEFI